MYKNAPFLLLKFKHFLGRGHGPTQFVSPQFDPIDNTSGSVTVFRHIVVVSVAYQSTNVNSPSNLARHSLASLLSTYHLHVYYYVFASVHECPQKIFQRGKRLSFFPPLTAFHPLLSLPILPSFPSPSLLPSSLLSHFPFLPLFPFLALPAGGPTL